MRSKRPETPWWLRRPNPNASSAPPLPPEAIRYLQEEDKRRWAHIEALHKKHAVESSPIPEAAPIADDVTNNVAGTAPSPPPPEPEVLSPPPAPTVVENPVVADDAPPSSALSSDAPPSINQALDAIAQFIRGYLVCTDHQLTLLVLWVVHTYCFDLFPATPYLNVSSPEKQSGKSVCLQVLNLLCSKPWMPAGVAKSRIMGRIANSQPTLLLDDWNTVFHAASSPSPDAQPIVGFFNAGSTGAYRDASSPENDSSPLIFCPKVFAGLGDLPASLADRCIPIALKRKKPNEPAHPFWPELGRPKATRLVEPLPAWIKKNGEDLMLTAFDFLYASSPGEILMRQREFVAPLFAIAKLAGGKWLRKLRNALRKTFNPGPVDPPTIGLQLLTDIRAYFAREHDPPKIHSAPLLDYLNRLEDRSWKTKQKRLTPNSMRTILRDFSIEETGPQAIGDKNLRGFTFRHFSDSWQRYLPRLSSTRSPQVVTVVAADTQVAAKVSQIEPQVVTDQPQAVIHHPQGVNSDPQDVITNVQGVITEAEGVINHPQGVIHSQSGKEIPNVFNICANQPANSNAFQPKQVPGPEQPAGKDSVDGDAGGGGHDTEDRQNREDQSTTSESSLPAP